MRTHLRTIALVFAVALAAAGGGYALGTQIGGGTAAAHPGHARAAAHPRFAARPRLASLAGRLGVSPAKLRSALRAVRAERIAARRKALAGQLAQKLGLPESKVESALPAFGPRRGFMARRACRRGP